MYVTLKLVQVQSFFRHGARTPLHYVISPITDTPWSLKETTDVPETVIPFRHVDIETGNLVDESTVDLIYDVKLPGGALIGMLTSIGQKDMFRAGQRLRADYAGNILSNPPKQNEIRVRSTRVGRNIKSMRCLVAGILEGKVDKPLDIPTMAFETEVLFPNPKSVPLTELFDAGTAELRQMKDLANCKEKIKKALHVDKLVDELDDDKDNVDCQVYYVRDDYWARKHNNFPIPKGLEALADEIDIFAAAELMNEIHGEKRNWRANLSKSIGPILHIILSNMRKYAKLEPLLLYTVHDSTLLPILVAFECLLLRWPPFAADITIELYSQVSGPLSSELLGESGNFASQRFEGKYPDSTILWPTEMLKNFWIRVKYVNEPLPLARYWGIHEKLQTVLNSDEYVPLGILAEKWAKDALIPSDYMKMCNELRNHSIGSQNKHVPKNM